MARWLGFVLRSDPLKRPYSSLICCGDDPRHGCLISANHPSHLLRLFWRGSFLFCQHGNIAARPRLLCTQCTVLQPPTLRTGLLSLCTIHWLRCTFSRFVCNFRLQSCCIPVAYTVMLLCCHTLIMLLLLSSVIVNNEVCQCAFCLPSQRCFSLC